VLLPPWLAYALRAFAILAGFSLLILTGSNHRKDVGTTAAGLLVISLLFSVAHGIWYTRRFRRTILASDEYSYTVRVEWIRMRRTPDEPT
jgi:hypothetical protein